MELHIHPTTTDPAKQTRRDGRVVDRQPSPVRHRRANSLIDQYNLPVNQGKSDREGKWYDQPTAYPLALFDAHGVVIIQTEAEFKTLASTSEARFSARRDGRTDTVYFRHGISQLGDYMTFADLADKVWVRGHWRETPTVQALSPKMLGLQQLLRDLTVNDLEDGLTVYIGRC